MTLEEVKRIGELYAHALGWGNRAWHYWPKGVKAEFQELLGECGYRLKVVDAARAQMYVVAHDGLLLTADDHDHVGIALEVLP